MVNTYDTLEEMQKEWPLYEGKSVPGQLQTGDVRNFLTVLYKTKKGKVIYFACQCKCGKYKVAAQDKIKSGHTQSCGCKNAEHAAKQVKDLTNQVFGKLTVLKQVQTEKRGSYWLCECSCYDENGKHPQKIIKGNSLTTGRTKSCGCLNKERITKIGKDSLIDLTGQKFGHWTVIERADTRYTDFSKQTMWLCECDCKNKTRKIINGYSLRNGSSQSCGCQKVYKGEEKIEEILINNNILFEKQKTFETCYINKGKPLRFDFYLLNSNILIEYDGIQHFEITGGKIGSKENFEKVQERDNFKNQWCIENKIPLIRIPYTHLDKICLEDLQLETSKFIVAGTRS